MYLIIKNKYAEELINLSSVKRILFYGDKEGYFHIRLDDSNKDLTLMVDRTGLELIKSSIVDKNRKEDVIEVEGEIIPEPDYGEVLR